MPRLAAVFQRTRQRNVFVNQHMEARSEVRGFLEAAVVREIDALRHEREFAFDGGVHRVWIELHGRGGGKDEWAGRAVEFAIGEAEGGAGEHAAARFVVNAVVMTSVARCVDERQRSCTTNKTETNGRLD